MRRRSFVVLALSASSAAIGGCADDSNDSGSRTTERDTLERRGIGTPEDTGASGGTASSTGDAATDETASATDEPSSAEPDTPGEQGEDERNAIGYPEERLDVRDVEYRSREGEDGGPTVTGVVENVSGETLSYVEVKVQAYDEGGEQISDQVDDTTDLGDGESWAFEIEFWDTEAENVAYWTGRVEISDY